MKEYFDITIRPGSFRDKVNPLIREGWKILQLFFSDEPYYYIVFERDIPDPEIDTPPTE